MSGCAGLVPFPPGPVLGRRVFPGRPVELAQLRCWLAGLLPDVPARDDVVAVAVELATNAIKHTASGRGGVFTVAAGWRAESAAVRVVVADGGAPAGPRWPAGPPSRLASHGIGLYLVRCLAARTGVSGGRRGRRVWAEVAWAGQPAAAAPGAAGASRREG